MNIKQFIHKKTKSNQRPQMWLTDHFIESSEIKQMIRKGEGQEYYQKWAKHHDSSVRYTLAETGYAPDIFIHDKELPIRELVLRKYPEYLPHLLGSSENLMLVNEYLEMQTEISVPTLKQHITDLKNDKSGYHTEDMETKLKALLYEPTAIEQTMSPLQLYQAGSPLWAKPFTPLAIYQIQSIERSHGKDAASPLVDPLMSTSERQEIMWEIGKDDDTVTEYYIRWR